MLKKTLLVITTLVLAFQVGMKNGAVASQAPEPARPSDQAAQILSGRWQADGPGQDRLGTRQPAATDGGVNLLVNGDFDDPRYPFYWRPTNHFVGGMWYEWFAVEIPEFIDGGINHHNVCYPQPTNGICVDDYHNSSQGYIRWGAPFVAGIYQPVAVTPCHYYKFEMYNRNDNDNYHPKVGIDPTGQGLPAYIPPDGEGLPVNCPPDGHSKCPNPGLKNPADLPPHIVWSSEFDHTPFTWAAQSVTAEAVSTTLTVWTYTAPEQAGSLSAYWDAGSLIEVPPPSGVLAEGTLPAPDGALTGLVTATTAFRATLSWQTDQPATSQVLYHYVDNPTAPIAGAVSQFELHTPIDNAWRTTHSVRLPNLRPRSFYDYAILSRKLVGGACQTSVLVGRLKTTDILIPSGPLPPAGADIIGLQVLPFEHSAYVIWQSAKPSYAQLLYSYGGSITPTLSPSMTWHTYLPFVSTTRQATPSTADLALRSLPDTHLTTLHVMQLTGLQPYSNYQVAAVSAWNEGDQDKSAAGLAIFTTLPTPSRLVTLSPDQLAARLQSCLTNGEELAACVNHLDR